MIKLRSKSSQRTMEKKNAQFQNSGDEHNKLIEKGSLRSSNGLSSPNEAKKFKETLIEWPQFPRSISSPSLEDAAARKDAENYIERAKDLQMEQEDEVKVANKVILATKCQAIRDAQIEEKLRLQAEFEAEERRLEKQMEEDRVQVLEAQKRGLEQKRLSRMRYAKILEEQIKVNKQQRQLEEEKALIEAERLQALHRQKDLEDAELEKAKALQERKIKQELARMNEIIKHRRALEFAHEKMAGLKIQQYMIGKTEREAEREERKRRLRQIQEREVARLRALQVRQQEVRDRAFEETVEREQEKVAREWRTRELEAAKRRTTLEEEIHKERVKQALERERILALEVKREEERIATVAKMQAEEEEKQRLEQERQKKVAADYRETLQRQIAEKEERRRQTKIKFIEEARLEREAIKAKELNLRGSLEKKVTELRKFKVPEKYISGVERQLGLTEHATAVTSLRMRDV